MSSHRGGTWGVFIKSTGGGRREGFGGQSEIRWQEIRKVGKNSQQSFLKEKVQRGANHSSHTHAHNELSGNRRSSRGSHVEFYMSKLVFKFSTVRLSRVNLLFLYKITGCEKGPYCRCTL